MEFYRERLRGKGPTPAAEKLDEAGCGVEHETLRRWLFAAGLWERSRRRRARKEHFGELVQMDGSIQDWLGTARSRSGATRRRWSRRTGTHGRCRKKSWTSSA